VLAQEEAARVATSSSALSHASGAIGQNDGSPNEEAMVDLDDSLPPDDDGQVDNVGQDDDDSNDNVGRSIEEASLDSQDSFTPYDDDMEDNLVILGFGCFLLPDEEDEDVDDNKEEEDRMDDSSMISPAAEPLYGDSEQQPVIEDALDLTDLEEASLNLVSLCDDSGARRGFYNELLTLLRRFQKKKIDITKAKGRDSFLRDMEKKVKTPKPKSTMVGGRDIVYFPFIDTLRNLLRSTPFNNVGNLCMNREEEDHFNSFKPSTPQDFSEIMSKVD